MPRELPPAALVVLDKVLCCYPEIDTLLAMSLARSERLYAVVVPRPHWLVAAVWRVAIAVFKLLRSSFHPYYHGLEPHRGSHRRRRLPPHLRRAHPGLGGLDLPPRSLAAAAWHLGLVGNSLV